MVRARRRVVLAGVGLVALVAVGVALGLLLRPSQSPALARGAELYDANCLSCHGGPTGGRMMDYPPRHNANGHTWHHADCELKDVIRHGSTPMTEAMRRMMAPPDAPQMPAWRDKLSEEEIELVLQFIKTMWTPEQRRYQAQITLEQC